MKNDMCENFQHRQKDQNPIRCNSQPVILRSSQRHQRSGNEASPCHAELVKVATLKNQENGLSCGSGKTLLVRQNGCTFVSASAQFLAQVSFPRANANGERGRLFKQAARTPLSTSKKLLSRTLESRFASNQKLGYINCRIANASRLDKVMRRQSKEHWTSGYFPKLGTFRLRTWTTSL